MCLECAKFASQITGGMTGELAYHAGLAQLEAFAK